MKKKYPGVKYTDIDGYEVYVDAVAGHVGDKLRFYVVFTTLDDRKPTQNEQAKLQSQLDASMVWHKCTLESFNVKDDCRLFVSLLMPWDMAPQTPIDAFLDITSTQDKVLRYYFYLTNQQNPANENMDWYYKESQDHNITISIDG